MRALDHSPLTVRAEARTWIGEGLDQENNRAQRCQKRAGGGWRVGGRGGWWDSDARDGRRGGREVRVLPSCGAVVSRAEGGHDRRAAQRDVDATGAARLTRASRLRRPDRSMHLVGRGDGPFTASRLSNLYGDMAIPGDAQHCLASVECRQEEESERQSESLGYPSDLHHGTGLCEVDLVNRISQDYTGRAVRCQGTREENHQAAGRELQSPKDAVPRLGRVVCTAGLSTTPLRGRQTLVPETCGPLAPRSRAQARRGRRRA